MDESTTPLTPLALVQWVGLPPEDTFWETWDNLQSIYNLANKVYFKTGGIDSEISTIEAPMQPTKIPMPPINTASNQEARGTSRIHKRLAHLRDYVSS